MTKTAHITQTEASGETIGELVGLVEDVLVGAEAGHVVIALLSLILIMQRPDMSPEQLQVVLKDVSHYICLSLDGIDTIDTPANLLN